MGQENDRQLEKLQNNQQFLIDQIVRIPHENERLEGEIKKHKLEVEKINAELDQLTEKRKFLELKRQRMTEVQVASSMLQTSLNNLKEDYRHHNDEIKKMERDADKLDRQRVDRQASLDKSIFHYRTILEYLEVEKPIDGVGLKELRKILASTISEVSDANKLKEKRKQLEKGIKFKEGSLSQEVKQLKQQLESMDLSIKNAQDEKLQLEDSQQREKELQKEILKKLGYYRDKLKYQSNLPELTDLKIQVVDQEEINKRKGKKFSFKSESNAYNNIDIIPRENNKQLRESIDQLIDRKIDLTNKLSSINAEINSQRQSFYVRDI